MRPRYQSVQDLLLEFSSLASVDEESAQLRTAQREIDPLHSKTDNPVKQAVRASAKAKQSKDVSDIAGATGRTRVATLYAKSHGYPNLTKQLGRHKEMLRKFAVAVKKRKAAQGKEARKAAVHKLKSKLWKIKLRRRHAASER